MLGLTAGLTAGSVSGAHALPRAYKDVVIEWAKETLPDPYEMRSTAASEPTPLKARDGSQISVVCVEFNARNGYGGYMGIDRMPFVETAGQLVPGSKLRVVDTATCYQPGVVLRPFPELGKIR